MGLFIEQSRVILPYVENHLGGTNLSEPLKLFRRELVSSTRVSKGIAGHRVNQIGSICKYVQEVHPLTAPRICPNRSSLNECMIYQSQHKSRTPTHALFFPTSTRQSSTYVGLSSISRSVIIGWSGRGERNG